MISILAMKYARAFDESYEKGLSRTDVDNIYRSLDELKSNKDALAFLHLVPGASQMSVVLDSFLEHFGLDRILHSLIVLLGQHKRLWLVPEILEALCDLYKEEHRIITADVTSAQPLREDEKDTIKGVINRRFGNNAEIIYHIDKKLLAGIRIQTPDFLWEYSVDDHIRSIGRSLGVGYRGN
jgi:F-type H+-transporting ATPase subunit delta